MRPTMNFDIKTDSDTFVEHQIIELSKEDIPRAKILCKECFPVQYPDAWYEKSFPSRSRIKPAKQAYGIIDESNERLLALLIADIQDIRLAEKEDITLDYSNCTKTRPNALYLSLLGVATSHRGRGYGSMILNHMFELISETNVQVVYLHVLSSNTTALSFYMRHGFHVHCRIPDYYELKDGSRDGIVCVKYVNGGKPAKFILHRALQTGCGCVSSMQGVFTWLWDVTGANVFKYIHNNFALTMEPNEIQKQGMVD